MTVKRPRIVLFEPRIPQNTGNIGRTCLAYDFPLDLIKPFGFNIEDKYLRRAGLDYWKDVDLNIYDSIENYKSKFNEQRIIGFSKYSNIPLSKFIFNYSDILLFGREDSGLTEQAKSVCDHIIKIPMRKQKYKIDDKGVRSLNLSVACGIVIYKFSESLNIIDI